MNIQLTYRRTGRLAMRIVKNGDVHVSAPIGMSEEEIEAFISQHQEWIVEARKKTVERQKQRIDFFSQLPLTTKPQKVEAMKKVRALIEPLMEYYTELIGVIPSSIRYKPMISRWGMCNVKERSICFSTYLLLLPNRCVEHVVVHELCHLLEPNHNVRFHALMDKYYPKWRNARKDSRRIAKGEHVCK